MAGHRQRLALFYEWKDPGSAAAVDTWLTDYATFEDVIYDALAAQYPLTTGWHLAAEAMLHYESVHGRSPDAAAVVKGIFAWHDAHPPAEGSTAEFGIVGAFFNWYTDMDAAHSTAYFTSRRDLLVLYSTEEPTFFARRAKAIDRQLAGYRDDPAACLQAWRDYYATELESSIAWTVEWYKEYNPPKAQRDKVEATYADWKGLEQQDQLRLALIRTYNPQLHLHLTTWASWLPPGSDEPQVRAALLEYFSCRCPERFSQLDQLVADFAQDPAALFTQLVQATEIAKAPEAAARWLERAEKKERPLFFPPWRCADYPLPSDVDDGMATALPDGKELEQPEGGMPPRDPRPPRKDPPRPLGEEAAQGEGGGEREGDAGEGPADDAAEATVAAAAQLPAAPPAAAVDWRGGEELTDADLDGGGGAAEPADAGGDAELWSQRIDRVMQAVAPLPDPEMLRHDARGPSYEAAREGWLCYSVRPEVSGAQLAVVRIETPPDAEHREGAPPPEDLCPNCTAKVVRCRRALWAPVEKHDQMRQDEEVLVQDGVCEVIDEGGFFSSGGGWVRRYVRATGTGLHVYDVADQPKEGKTGPHQPRTKPLKAKASRFFTPETRFVADPRPGEFPGLKTQPGYTYFGFVLRAALPAGSAAGGGRAAAGEAPAAAAGRGGTESHFWMRCQDKTRDAERWKQFFSDAMERFRSPDELGDPNPAKWRARVPGLQTELEKAEAAARAATAEAVQQAALRRDEEERRAAAEAERDWAELQAAHAESRSADMRRLLGDAERQREADRADAEARLRDAEQLRAHAAELCQQAQEETDEAEAAIESAKQRVRDREEELRRALQERDAAQLETRRVFAKWRQCEERAPDPSVERAQRREGLRYRPPQR
eukprot:TRINITY_DN5121_c0_g3_i1.p1 TRINITY_DN5121_c0_g3~~TRINITY_DN5121_c0_g3_i1.p1  ORF type:complete len:885 (+),score=331.03 TRINITY_DN5121_c0_g3_i1:72-2726(+)